VPVTLLIPHEVAERCYLSEAVLWAAFSRLPSKILDDDSREEGSYNQPFGQCGGIEPVTSEECNRVGLSPRPIWDGDDSYLDLNHLDRLIGFERSDEKKNKLKVAYYEAKEFRKRLLDWNRKFDQLTEQPRLKLLKDLQEERLGATGKRLPMSTIGASFNLMDKEIEGWAPPKYVDREPILPDFWSAAEIDWSESLAEGYAEGRAIAYGLILIEVTQLLKEFPLPNGDPYGGVRKAGDCLVLTSPDEFRGGPKQGRPSFNWVEFHLEMAERVRDGLPSKKDACILDMEKWCATECGQKHSGANDQTVLRQIRLEGRNSEGLTF
jgi:hypothetical protein